MNELFCADHYLNENQSWPDDKEGKKLNFESYQLKKNFYRQGPPIRGF
jgi:hypothetical protein